LRLDKGIENKQVLKKLKYKFIKQAGVQIKTSQT